jgi:hypothetical protein
LIELCLLTGLVAHDLTVFLVVVIQSCEQLLDRALPSCFLFVFFTRLLLASPESWYAELTPAAGTPTLALLTCPSRKTARVEHVSARGDLHSQPGLMFA